MSNSSMRLEFAPRAQRKSMVGLILLLASALLLATLLAMLVRSLAQNASLTEQSAVAEGKPLSNSRAPARPVQQDPESHARVELIRKTARNMATPWAELLGALESTPSNIALLAVEPQPVKHTVTLTAEAASESQMFAYMRLLQSDKRLSDVVLMQHQIQLQTPGTPLRFQLQAHWGKDL